MEIADKVVRLGDVRRSRSAEIETIDFVQFYSACIKTWDDKEGPASAAWDKLSDVDRHAIGALLKDGGAIDLQGMWAVRWLKLRKWEREQHTSGEASPPRVNELGPQGALLRARLGDDMFAAWFSKARVVTITSEAVTLSVPTRFLAKWIKENFAAAIIDCWGRSRVDMVVRP